MIRALTFTKDWRCFQVDDRFDFRPGVNLLVGDQGCGKSSLIRAIHVGGCTGKDFGSDKEMRDRIELEASPVTMYKFDFEKDNPRMQRGLGKNAMFQLSSMWASHGETSRIIIQNIEGLAECLILMDEPDMAFSIRSCNQLVKTFRDVADRGSQVLAAVHSETVIRQFEEVYSLEHRKWMPSAEFIESQADATEFIPRRKPEKKRKKSGFHAPSKRKKSQNLGDVR
jgi:predicted ATPase